MPMLYAGFLGMKAGSAAGAKRRTIALATVPERNPGLDVENLRSAPLIR
jgi:hypothetical protein